MKAPLHRTRFWVVTAAALVMVALTFSLGLWQLDRAGQKKTLQASLDQKKNLQPLGNQDIIFAANHTALTDRPVTLSGRWLPQFNVYLDNRPMNGRPGFWVMTPLALDGSQNVILVQRGWIPRDFQDRQRLAFVETPEATVSIQGRMAPAPAKLYDFKGADTGVIRQNLDIAAFRVESELPLIDAIVIQTGPASEGLLRDWAMPNTGVDKHYGYAVQWFLLSLLVLGLYLWFQLFLPRRQRLSIHRHHHEI